MLPRAGLNISHLASGMWQMLNDWFLQVGRECLSIYVCKLIRQLVIKESGAYSLQTIIKYSIVNSIWSVYPSQNSFANFCGAHICSFPLVMADEGSKVVTWILANNFTYFSE